MSYLKTIGLALSLALLISIPSEGTLEQETSDLIDIRGAYNQAYQENYQADSLETILNSAVNSYVLLDPDEVTQEDLTAIKANSNVVSAYISIGTAEKWREDFDSLKPYTTQNQWAEWKDEYFVQNLHYYVKETMKKRIDKVVEMGFDWIEFDNMDFAFDDVNRVRYGIKVPKEDAVKYYQDLCTYAQEKGLKVMAKNTFRDIESFDGITLESYDYLYNWWSKKDLKAFMKTGKLALIVHYNDENPPQTYMNYEGTYGQNLLLIIESKILQSYVHFN
jgi:endo-alpha-1,4-polygalactosaminidase (GH114 family)